ncbi:MAG: DUF6240 domain-containing protein [Roseburia sp.]|nr:DUF6240 domain-containing protein [Roseburia sp.]MCM1241645.1 DUF6240 domain-containing protein [Roseburia sp.]
MKITFDTNTTNQNVDKVATTAYRDTRTEKSEQNGVFALDISGTVMDNKAYKGQGKTAEDVMQEAGQIDTATQRDYMTVMSNSMSADDFGQMMKDGYQVGDMEIEEVVTIVDKIKAELIKGGTRVAGYTDQIDAETLEEITGSEVFARELCQQFMQHDIPVTEENVRDAVEAYHMAKELDPMTEGAVKYMVENHMEPTIDNLYLAQHSSTADGDRQGKGYYECFSQQGYGGYYAKKAEDFHWQQLYPQMEAVIQKAGLEVGEDTLDNAKWLIEKGIPLTEESLRSLSQLDSLVLPQEEKQILSAIASAIADGKEAGRANLTDDRSNLEKAAEYADRFAQVTEEAIEQTIVEGRPLTLPNLENAQKQLAENAETLKKNQTSSNQTISEKAAAEVPETSYVEHPQAITARRQLEEIRFMMTVEANLRLLKTGFVIDTSELGQLVEALKQIETQQKQLMFGEEDAEKISEKSALYAETRRKIDEIPYMPADVSGRFKVTDEDFTLDQVHIEGSALRNKYEDAREKYETLMTTPSREMGDSIQKAFQNVDDILEDLDFETTEENRRAVRILSYNNMELSKENIQAAKATDMQLRQVIEKMTPAAVLQTIRDGRNPLEMTVPELNAYLDSMTQTKEQEAEKYSRFLYKLDKNKEIDAQERSAYIGIYRMFRQLEKTDDAAVGMVINTGVEFSFKNLLHAVRSNKKLGMDFTIDDSFDGIEAIAKNISITEQINAGFNRSYQDIVRSTADRMARQDASTEAEYQQDKLQDYREINQVEDSVINELLNNKQPVTVNNLLAADMLMNQRGFLYKKLDEYTKPADKDKVRDALSHMQEAMTDKESAQEAYEAIQQVYEEVLEEAQYDPQTTYIDLKTIQSCQKQLALTGSLAQEENYQIPVEIHGEMTAIHLKVLHGKEDGGKVKAAFSTEEYGNIAAEFSIRKNKISGYIACSTAEGTARMQEAETDLRAGLEAEVKSLAGKELELGSISVIHSKDLDLNAFTAEQQPETAAVRTADLYQIAKAFITTVTA